MLSTLTPDWSAVVTTVVAAAILALWAALWTRRRRVLDLRDGVKARVEESRVVRQLDDRRRREQAVLERAAVLDRRVPIKAEGRYPVVVVTYSGLEHMPRYYVSDDIPFGSEGEVTGNVNPRAVFRGRPPRVLSQWTDQEIADWQERYRDDLPEDGASA